MTDEVTSEAELPLDTAGTRLKRAREDAGMTLKQVAEATKIPERHLAALEAGSYAALPARTYATGFARSYARLIGIEEAPIIAAVREELAAVEPEPPRRVVQTFEPGDPSRLPSAGLAWVAGLLALVAVAAAVYFVGRGGAGADALPSLLPEETAAAPAQAPLPATPTPAGPVVFTALAPDIWVKFYDGAGVQLLQKELAQGETYTVPASSQQVLLWTARPEALGITIGGAPVAKLSEIQRMIKDVPVTAAALLARGAPGQAGQAAPAAAPVTTPDGTSAPRNSQRRERAVQPQRAAPRLAPDDRAPPPPVDAVPPLSPAPEAATGPAPAAT